MTFALSRSDYETHRRRLFGLAYRMTGSFAESEDIVQETYARALTRRTEDDRALGPWLCTVTLNLARDYLRRRKRRRYIGPWLPEPIPTDDPDGPVSFEVERQGLSTAGRYDLLESVELAFLVALEALTPTQRAVLLLRDVFGYTVAETQQALGMSESNVKVTLLRGRRALETYDEDRSQRSRNGAQHQQALGCFLAAAAAGDQDSVERLMLETASAWSDGAGEVRAARRVVRGLAKVALFHTKLAMQRQVVWFEARLINGLPAVVCELAPAGPEMPIDVVFQLDLSAAGAIRKTFTMVAPSKLRGVPFDRMRLAKRQLAPPQG